MTQPHSIRQQQIDAIRRLADFYEQHPNEPMPHQIVAARWTYTVGDGPEVDRIIAVADWSKQHDAELTEGERSVHAAMVFADVSSRNQAEHLEIRITHTTMLEAPTMPSRIPEAMPVEHTRKAR